MPYAIESYFEKESSRKVQEIKTKLRSISDNVWHCRRRWAYRREFFPESTQPAGSVSESMWPRLLHDTSYLSNIVRWLSATRSGNAVLCDASLHHSLIYFA